MTRQDFWGVRSYGFEQLFSIFFVCFSSAFLWVGGPSTPSLRKSVSALAPLCNLNPPIMLIMVNDSRRHPLKWRQNRCSSNDFFPYSFSFKNTLTQNWVLPYPEYTSDLFSAGMYDISMQNTANWELFIPGISRTVGLISVLMGRHTDYNMVTTFVVQWYCVIKHTRISKYGTVFTYVQVQQTYVVCE